MQPSALRLVWLTLITPCVFSATRIELAAATKPGANQQHSPTPANANLRSTPMAAPAAQIANAGVVLEWNANTDPDVAGYKLFYGTTSRNYTAQRDVGKVTRAIVPELTLGATYYFAMTAYNSGALESKPSTEVQVTAVQVSPTPTAKRTVTAVPTPTPTPSPVEIPHTGWAVTFVDNEELVGEGGQPRANAIDGNPSTMWHTQWQAANPPPPPHEIQIDLGATNDVAGFGYLPRQDGSTVGMIAKYEFYVSADGAGWGTAVASGTFPRGAAEKRILFTPKVGRYVRLRALTEVHGKQWTSVAEVNVLGLPTPPPGTPPTSPSSAYALAITPVTASVPSTGGTASYFLSVTPTGGFSSAITLNIDGSPAGGAVSYSANPFTTKSTLNITLAACVPNGTYTFTVRGFGCGTPPVMRAVTATVVKE